MGSGAVMLVAAVAVTLVVVGGDDGDQPAALTTTSVSVGAEETGSTVVDASELGGIERFSGLTRSHVTTRVSYPQKPPVGGDHHADPMPCRAYPEPVPDERAVHSLEHGAVWLTDRSDVPQAQVDALRGWTTFGYVLVSPYPGQADPVVATAWGVQLRLPSADDPRLPRFVERFRQGAQTPEPGSAC
jgi:hypothetical protein